MNLASRHDSITQRFLSRVARIMPAGLEDQALVLDNPTEELLEANRRHRQVKLFAKSVRGKIPSRAIARLEENNLYSTRRFPTATNNTIGSGALAVNTYPFFGQPAGGDGGSAGFPTGFVLSLNETNMELPGQIPQGQSFVFNQLGISFNSGTTVADADTMMEAGSLQFSKAGGQFTLNHGQLKMWPGGTGNGGFAAAATTVAATTLNVQNGINGSPDLRTVRHLKIARVLKANDVFSYSIVIPRTTKSIDGTAWALSQFVAVTIWLFGGWKSAIAA